MAASASSSGVLSRARSLRKPKPGTKPETTSSSGEGQRNVSPSRLPIKDKPPTIGRLCAHNVDVDVLGPPTREHDSPGPRSAGTGTGGRPHPGSIDPAGIHFNPDSNIRRRDGRLGEGQPRASAHPRQVVRHHTRERHHSPPAITDLFHFFVHRYNRCYRRNSSDGPSPSAADELQPQVPCSANALPSNIAISAETARLQTELLQLHLLHRGSHAVLGEWQNSARAALRRRWEAVRDREEQAAGVEGAVEEATNIAALLAWAAGGGGSSGGGGGGARRGPAKPMDDERVVLLDAVLSPLWAATERHDKLVRHFERWARRAEEILASRRDDGGGGGAFREFGPDGELVLLGEMDAAWKAECAALARRLDDWRRKLQDLGAGHAPPTEDKSSLARILAGCRALVHGMLAELDVMEEIEREAVAEEMRWVREMNRRGLGGADEETRPAGAIWRAL
ncbi:hypothetical protein MMYC01_207911 [Madurella mycetomatis]|uniref:Uncharacterized protein n=1 Tax=Madurella mycetomatis TaxID=100816 RepID=A0A175VYN9_9PEZI|nr:hypothetical protein MMYC01_207911 [Madurella mycetomatis]